MPYNVSKFAKSHMQQAGWVEGKGLGKNEDGRSEAIKVKIKADTAGIGHDPAEQFTFHWWEHAFSKSAQNIKVTESSNGVEVVAKTETEKASTRKQDRKLLKQELLYGSFVKSGVLEHGAIKKSSNCVEQSDTSDSEPETAKKSKVLTDAELLHACGGRTAHKGARHGVNLSGKLARLQEQEVDDSGGSPKKKKKRKRKNKEANSETMDTTTLTLSAADSETSGKQSKKVKKKKKQTSDVSEKDCETNGDFKKNRRKKLKKEIEDVERENKIIVSKKKKRKRKLSLTEIERKV